MENGETTATTATTWSINMYILILGVVITMHTYVAELDEGCDYHQWLQGHMMHISIQQQRNAIHRTSSKNHQPKICIVGPPSRE